ncbi:MAG: response regulator [Bacteroidetes bacterium]|nr:response regulator [Bacteroidota bacterium]MBU1679472.1 response regulator [Bacteroidota bacterium]MBU2508555.1 response regulator [Bacteroidota bacterium]
MKNSGLSKDVLKEFVKDEESLEKLSKLIESSNAPNSNANGFQEFEDVFWCKSEPGSLTKFNYSSSITDITGYTGDEINALPGKFFSLIHEDDIDRIRIEFSEILADRGPTKGKLSYKLFTKDENIVWINEIISITRSSDGKAQELISVAFNISEIFKKFSELESVFQKTKNVLSAKDNFISIISHDLRAPFTSLLGFSEILINEPGLPVNERIEYLEYIHDASFNQLQFINHLLDWSRLQTGKIKVELKRLHLKEVVSNCVSSQLHSAIRKSIDIKVGIPDSIYVKADERLIGECVINLLNNSTKFSEEYKTVHVSAQKFKEGMVEIVVKDEGIGIPEENQSKLFRIDQKYTTKGTKGEKGSGMGLNLVHEIVAQHNGVIWFYSKPGEGSEFHFTIPEAKNVIVLVEDDNELRTLFKRTLQKNISEYEIIEADNGYEAMSLILANPPSVIITDHDMPLMLGTQLVEAIRKKDKKNIVQIIVISAKFTDEIIEKYNRLGVQKLVRKPCSPDALTQIVKEVLS